MLERHDGVRLKRHTAQPELDVPHWRAAFRCSNSFSSHSVQTPSQTFETRAAIIAIDCDVVRT
jgi:hypothetical protein